jgi:tRNA(Ile)-lysidine synthetase-like protein
LLDKLASAKPGNVIYVVAHVDHGIRTDSEEDAKFVEDLAKKYGFAYEQTRLELGKNSSENQAREARYEYLYSLKAKYNADAIITAHHQDDVLETMFVNMLRGTGPRGLVGFSRQGILRPFIHKTKQDLNDYANENDLSWREDSTNSDEAYLRNYVRANFMPKLGSNRSKFLEIRENTRELTREIDTLSKKLVVNCMRKGELVRARFVILPLIVQHEFVATWLRLHNITFDELTIRRLTVALKTGRIGSRVDINSGSYLSLQKETIVLIV